MVYADANILVRYIVDDNKDMADMAEEAIFSGALFVLPEVFVEVVYVLNKVYGIARAAIAQKLSLLLSLVGTMDSSVMRLAFSYYGESNLDFVDCILAAHKIENKMEVLSFDKKLNSFIRCKDVDG